MHPVWADWANFKVLGGWLRTRVAQIFRDFWAILKTNILKLKLLWKLFCNFGGKLGKFLFDQLVTLHLYISILIGGALLTQLETSYFEYAKLAPSGFPMIKIQLGENKIISIPRWHFIVKVFFKKSGPFPATFYFFVFSIQLTANK